LQQRAAWAGLPVFLIEGLMTPGRVVLRTTDGAFIARDAGAYSFNVIAHFLREISSQTLFAVHLVFHDLLALI
jgi:hypothetical protein